MRIILASRIRNVSQKQWELTPRCPHLRAQVGDLLFLWRDDRFILCGGSNTECLDWKTAGTVQCAITPRKSGSWVSQSLSQLIFRTQLSRLILLGRSEKSSLENLTCSRRKICLAIVTLRVFQLCQNTLHTNIRNKPFSATVYLHHFTVQTANYQFWGLNPGLLYAK
jgi:hypothetical protein